jgi:glutamate formiminotransferase
MVGPKFKRGDNSTYTFTKRGGMYFVSAIPTKLTIFLHAHLQVVYYNCVKFHKTPISRLVGVALTRYMPPFS